MGIDENAYELISGYYLFVLIEEGCPFISFRSQVRDVLMYLGLTNNVRLPVVLVLWNHPAKLGCVTDSVPAEAALSHCANGGAAIVRGNGRLWQ